MKVVINRKFGGFGISNEAFLKLFKRNVEFMETSTPKKYYGGDDTWEEDWKKDFKTEYTEVEEGIFIHKHGFNIYKDGVLYDFNKYDKTVRTNEDLINIVEEMGEKSFGQFAKLEIIEIPNDVNWEIDEYDGVETIHECHRSWP